MMPLEDDSSEALPAVPDLSLAQTQFLLAHTKPAAAEAAALKKTLLAAIEAKTMAPYYKHVSNALGWKVDNKYLASLEAKNEVTLKEMDEKIADAAENLGESELREALLAKSEYLTDIGDLKRAEEATKKTMEKTVGVGNRMDLLFNNIRLGLFYTDHRLITENMEKAQHALDQGGDWDRRNRLKVYQGLYAMSVRDFSKAANLFLETISTFTSYELMDYIKFVTYVVYMGIIALDRKELLEKIIKGSEIHEILHGCPAVKRYLNALYDCQYGEFFTLLADVEQELKGDRYLFPHYAFYVREMKVKAFAQLLESYRSLTLTYMAEQFNVTEEYMDRELSRLIADGRLHCRIDKVRGIVVTNRPDSKNAQYQSTIKQGDILLNRVQKLSRVINI